MPVVAKEESFWKRHLVALIVGGFALLLVVIVAGQLLDDGDVAKWFADVPEQWAYVLCLLFVWFDAVIPIFPGETTLSAASTLAASGSLDLPVIMVVGALGAILGDSSLFWIARKSLAKVKPHLDEALNNPKVRAGWDALGRSPGLLIMAGRYVPGMRFAVNASMGLSDMPYRRFLPWSAASGALWSVYTCALAYWVSTTLAGYPLASLIISSLITSAALRRSTSSIATSASARALPTRPMRTRTRQTRQAPPYRKVSTRERRRTREGRFHPVGMRTICPVMPILSNAVPQARSRTESRRRPATTGELP